MSASRLTLYTFIFNHGWRLQKKISLKTGYRNIKFMDGFPFHEVFLRQKLLICAVRHISLWTPRLELIPVVPLSWQLHIKIYGDRDNGRPEITSFTHVKYQNPSWQKAWIMNMNLQMEVMDLQDEPPRRLEGAFLTAERAEKFTPNQALRAASCGSAVEFSIYSLCLLRGQRHCRKSL